MTNKTYTERQGRLTEGLGDGDVGDDHDDGHHEQRGPEPAHHARERDGLVADACAERRQRERRQSWLHASYNQMEPVISVLKTKYGGQYRAKPSLFS